MNGKVKYNQLVTMGIKQAREAIVNNLVENWNSMEEELKSLTDELSIYEKDLSKARADGDTSENSAYDTAIDNVSSTQARIYETQKLQREMSLITEPEFVRLTRQSDYDDIIQVLRNVKEESLISELTFRHFNGNIEEIKTASRQNLKSLLTKCEYLIKNGGEDYDFNLSEQEIYEMLKDVVKYQKPRPYKPCGKVVMYSVVRADVNGEEYVFMVCPSGISYVEEGVIAANCELASKIMNNVVGESHTISDSLRYTIKEIY